jgi:trigger factor
MVTNWREKLSPEAETEYVRSEKVCVFNWLKVEQWRKVTSKSLWGLESVHYKKHQNTNGTIRTNKSTEEVQGIVARVLSNQDEVKKLSDQVVAEKLFV